MISTTTETAKIDMKMTNRVPLYNFTNIYDNKIPFFSRMRTRLLLLMVMSVLITQVLAFIPAIGIMQNRWLENQIKSAITLSYIVLDDKKFVLDNDLQNSILSATDSLVLSLTRNDGSVVTIQKNGQDIHVDRMIDLKKYNETAAAIDALAKLFVNKSSVIRLQTPIADSHQIFSMTFDDLRLRKAIFSFALQFFMISLIIAIVVTTIIYLIVYELLVRPSRNLYIQMLNFVAEPDNPNRIIIPGSRRDEMGMAQQRIAAIESELQKNHARQKHLANLGLAVSKINHDMRNILSSAQLISDHLAEVNDPLSKRLTPKLIHTIDRAIGYTQSVMAYGRTQEQKPHLQLLSLHVMLNDIKDNLAVFGQEFVHIDNDVSENFEILADEEQLTRVLTNLLRNAVQAMTIPGELEKDQPRNITITASYEKNAAIIDVIDTGPGLPAKAKEHLFAPFYGSASFEGTGLGLAICFELIRGHGGGIELVEGGSHGAHFRICMPMANKNVLKWYRGQKVLK